MSKFAGPHNAPNKGKIPKVTHLSWMKSRCWHGEEVVMMVVAENVPDGTPVELQIFPKGRNDLIDKVGGLKIAGAVVAHKYTIKWKDKLPARHGQEIIFKATVGKIVSNESPVLFVDLEPPVLSA